MTEEINEHSTRSPSGSAAWRLCPGKINAERGLPDKVGREAAEGTLFHEGAEICLLTGIEPRFLPHGEPRLISGHTVSWNQEMCDHLTAGLDYLAELIEPGDLVFIETRVRIEGYTLEEGGFGTSDVIIIKVAKRKIIVFDWKYGKIAVSPIENSQEILYGLGAWETVAGEIFDWDPTDIEVDLIIWQPRIPDGGGLWSTTMEWMLQEGHQIRIDAAATYDPDAPRVPGDKQCRYCKRRGRCAEEASWRLATIGLRFEEIDQKIEWDPNSAPVLDDVSEWTEERRSYVWLHRKGIIRWLEKLGELIADDYRHGRPTPFIKAVQGNAGHRAYKPDALEAVKAYLTEALGADKAFEPAKLISPAVAEEKLGRKRYREDLALYVDQPEGKPILVPVTHKKTAIPPIAARFDSIEEDESEGD